MANKTFNSVLFQQIDYMEKMSQPFEKIIDENVNDKEEHDRLFQLYNLHKSIISNLWELVQERGGRRSIGDLMSYLAAKKGGAKLLNLQIEHMQATLEQLRKEFHIKAFFTSNFNKDTSEIFMVESIIESLTELKQRKY